MSYNDNGWSNGGGGGGRKRGRDFDDDGGQAGGYRRQQRRFNDHDQPIAPFQGRDYSGMSGYSGGGGGRRGGRGGGRGRNYHDRHGGGAPLLSAGEKYCIDLWRFGDVIPNAQVDESSRFTSNSAEDLQGLADETRDLWAKGSKEDVLRGFRIAISECPHKLPYFAALLGLLASQTFTPAQAKAPVKPLVSQTNPDTGEITTEDPNAGDADMNSAPVTPATPAAPQPVNIGLEIVADLVKAFQNHLDARRWRSVRFYLHLFAHLASLSQALVTMSSLLSLLNQSFIYVLENEFSLRAERGDELVRIVLETLLRISGPSLDDQSNALETMKTGLTNYMASRQLDVAFLGDRVNDGQWIDPLDQLFQAYLSGGSSTPALMPKPDELVTVSKPQATDGDAADAYTPEPLSLPVISLPIDTDEEAAPLSAKISQPAQRGQTASAGDVDDFAREPTGYSAIRAQLSFFAYDQTVPVGSSLEGQYLNQVVLDILNVFEINRKDCARILLNDLPHWLPAGTFKTNPGAKDAEDADDMVTNESTVIKENVLMEVILSQLLATPTMGHRAVYYYSLITELCKLSPSTVAPALGKCIRKLYAGLGLTSEEAGPDAIVLGAEGIRRFSDWMATHLSNFGFHWKWTEWQADLDLPAAHPKKVLIARVLDLETRLSYHERIKSTLPDEYLSSSAGVFPADAPGPDFTYEVEGPSSYQTAATEILKLMRSRATVAEINELVEKLKDDFLTGEIGDEPVDPAEADRLGKDLVWQCMLVVGSRSFSHCLNVLERYIALLRETTNSSVSRIALLRTVSRFWNRYTLFRHIVFDKLLQYRVVDPIDVASFIFEGEQPLMDGEIMPRDWSDISAWDLMRMTLEKVHNRVMNASARLEALRKREENRADVERAAAGEMKTDVDGNDATNVEDTATTEAKTNEEAQAELSKVEKQVEAVRTEQSALIKEVTRLWHQTLSNSASEEDAWRTWFAQGWFAEFTRAFAGDLAANAASLSQLGLPEGSAVYEGIAGAQRWIEYV